MKKLVSRYIKLHKEVNFFERCAVILLAILFIYTFYSIYSIGLSKSLDQIGTLGVVLSAILVSKIASRQITHTELVVENNRISSLVMNMHFLMTVISDMSNKTYHIQSMLLDKQQANPAEADTLIAFVRDVEIGYQILRTKDGHEHLNGNTLVLIWSMSSNIEGLKVLAKLLTKPEVFNLPTLSSNMLLTILRGNELVSLNHATVAIDNILVTLEQIDKEVRELRNSIDLPAKLREEYEKI
jgi:hypothetical protein